MRSVNMVDLAGRHAAVAAETEARVVAVLRSGQYIGGPVVREAEALAAQWMGRRGAVGTGSGTDALALALQALEIGPGDEVIVPGLTFFATAGAVAAVGATPVIADVTEDGCLDPHAARRAWTRRTRAVIPVHLFGNLAPSPGLDVLVLDDAAQAIGGTPARSTGVLSTLSTYPTKTWGSSGDGGFVVGDDAELLERVRHLGRHGWRDGSHQRIGRALGRNTRLDAVQAAVLMGHAPALPERIRHRRRLASRYDRDLPPGVRPLPRHPGTPVHHYVVLVDRRDEVRRRMAELGVHTAVYYDRALHEQPALRGHGDAPTAAHLAARVLALPVHAGVSDEDAAWVLEALCQSVP